MEGPGSTVGLSVPREVPTWEDLARRAAARARESTRRASARAAMGGRFPAQVAAFPQSIITVRAMRKSPACQTFNSHWTLEGTLLELYDV